MNWNKYNFKEGDEVVLDKDFANNSIVTIVSFTPLKMFTQVKDENGVEW